MKNSIIAELRRIRDENAKRYNFDVDAIARDLMKLEPWMEKKTYTLHRGKLVPITLRRRKRSNRATTQRSGAKKTNAS